MRSIFRLVAVTLLIGTLSGTSTSSSNAAGCPKGREVLKHIKMELSKLRTSKAFHSFHPNTQMASTTIFFEDHNFLGPTIIYEVYWKTDNNISKAHFLNLSRKSLWSEPGKSIKNMYEWDRTTQIYKCPYQVTYENKLDGHVFLLNGKEKPGWRIWDWFMQ